MIESVILIRIGDFIKVPRDLFTGEELSYLERLKYNTKARTCTEEDYFNNADDAEESILIISHDSVKRLSKENLSQVEINNMREMYSRNYQNYSEIVNLDEYISTLDLNQTIKIYRGNTKEVVTNKIES